MQVDGRVVSGELPAGRYLQTVHSGHSDTLAGATASLLAHAETEGQAFDVVKDPDGERWTARLEFYLTDPEGGAQHGCGGLTWWHWSEPGATFINGKLVERPGDQDQQQDNQQAA